MENVVPVMTGIGSERSQESGRSQDKFASLQDGGLPCEILDAIVDPFLAVDANDRILYANRGALDSWGLTKSQVVGQIMWDRFPQLRRTTFGDRLRNAIR